MAFCKQCGADLNGANFCPSCGTAANADIVAAQPQNVAPVGADSRERSLAAMEHMLSYFGAKQAQYDEYETVTEDVEARKASWSGWKTLAGIALVIAIFLITNNGLITIISIPFAVIGVRYWKHI